MGSDQLQLEEHRRRVNAAIASLVRAETHLGPVVDPATAQDQAKTVSVSDLKRTRKGLRRKKEHPAVVELLDNWAEELGLKPSISGSIDPANLEQMALHLGVLLAMTRGTYELAHSFHWRTLGAQFYQDHLLFERVYGEVYGFIDGLGEKIVGITGHSECVEAKFQAQTTLLFLDKLPASQEATSFPADLLYAITELLKLIETLLQRLESIDSLTAGLDNFLQDMADKLETLVYLLRQRVASQPYA